MENTGHRIKVNYIFSIIYQISAVILPIITTPYVSRRLGVANVGHFSHVTSIVSYFTIVANMGTYTYGRREVGACQKSKEEYSEVFWNVFATKLIVGTVAIIAFSAFVGSRKQFVLLFWIEIFMILAQIFDISWFYHGIENYRITVTYQMAIKILGVIAIFLFVKKTDDLSVYTFIMSFLPFAGAISIFPFLRKIISRPRISIISISRHILGAFILFVPQVATSLYMFIDKTMLGYFYKDGIQNGLYEQATKIDQLGLQVVIALTSVMIPRLALYHKENDTESILKTSTVAIRYIMFIGAPLAFGISGIGYSVLPWFLGAGFDGSSNILQITAFIIIIMGLTNFLGYGYLVATRQQGTYTYTVFTGTFINIVTNAILIPRLGGIGAAMASLFSETIVLLIQLFLLSEQLRIRIVFKGTLRYLLLSFLMGCVVRYMSITLQPTISSSIVIVFTGMAIYGIPLFILKDNHILSLISSVKKGIRKAKNLLH